MAGVTLRSGRSRRRDQTYLAGIAREWDVLARIEPFGSVLSRPDLRSSWSVDRFFTTGEQEIQRVLADACALSLSIRRGRALDFGCGPGRVTHALAQHFERVDGVDLSPAMIALAKRLDRGGRGVTYHLNDGLELPGGGYDFVYSTLVLQHLRPRAIGEILRVLVGGLAPGGVLACQLPSHPTWTPPGVFYRLAPNTLRRVVNRHRYRLAAPVEMHWLRRRRVEALVEHSGGRVRAIQPDASAGPTLVSHRYWVTRGYLRDP